MIGSEDVQAPLRRAALALHALSEPDRRWILDALPQAAASALQPLLTELTQLGICADATMIGELLPPEPRHGGMRTALGSLDDAGVVALARVLEGEPPHVAGVLLAMRPWPWREQLLQAFRPTFALDVRSLFRAEAVAPALAVAVESAVERRLTLPPASEARSGGWWARLWNGSLDRSSR